MYKDEKRFAIPFAAWELRLYLDTHPDDANAIAAYKQLCAALGGTGYACDALTDGQSCPLGLAMGKCADMSCDNSCGCLSKADGNAAHWSWIDGPWPWQLEANLSDCEG